MVLVETEEKIERLYYSTNEAAKFLELPVRTIREWIRRFDIKCQRNSKNCARLTQKEIETLRTIKDLLNVQKYSFAGVEIQLKKQKENK